MQAEMERIVMETGQTCVFITHSIDEAIFWRQDCGDIISAGKLKK